VQVWWTRVTLARTSGDALEALRMLPAKLRQDAQDSLHSETEGEGAGVGDGGGGGGSKDGL
jgi:hypothetical protein